MEDTEETHSGQMHDAIMAPGAFAAVMFLLTVMIPIINALCITTA